MVLLRAETGVTNPTEVAPPILNSLRKPDLKAVVTPSMSLQVHQTGSLDRIIELETNQDYITRCGYMPIIAENQMITAEFPMHVLIWKGDGPEIIMHKVTNFADIKPLKDLKVEWHENVGFLSAQDIFSDPSSVQLYHVGRSSDTSLAIIDIQKRAGVKTMVNIQAGNRDDRRFDYYTVAYDLSSSTLSVLPSDGDLYLTMNLKGTEAAEREPFYKSYSKYLNNNGCVALDYMRDVMTLSLEQLKKKHLITGFSPNVPNIYRDPAEKMALDFSKVSGINLTEEQKRIFMNLSLIPPSANYSVYFEGVHTDGDKVIFVHPAFLGHAGIAGEVFRWTGDQEKLLQLDEYRNKDKKPEISGSIRFSLAEKKLIGPIASEKMRQRQLKELIQYERDLDQAEIKRVREKAADLRRLYLKKQGNNITGFLTELETWEETEKD